MILKLKMMMSQKKYKAWRQAQNWKSQVWSVTSKPACGIPDPRLGGTPYEFCWKPKPKARTTHEKSTNMQIEI